MHVIYSGDIIQQHKALLSPTLPLASRSVQLCFDKIQDEMSVDAKHQLRLKISVGSSYKDLSTAHVNDSSRPTHVDNTFFVGDIVVRVKNFKGLTPDNEPAKETDQTYFEATSDTSSVQFVGTVKADVSGDNLVFGNDFDEPINDSLPPGTTLGLKALKWIDPSLETDLYADKPWAFSPVLATMNLLNTTGDVKDLGRIEEDTSNLVKEKITTKQRRTHFADKSHRERYSLKDLSIAGDFSNPFIDFNTLSIALPYVNLHFSILQYWKGQPFRYTCKTKSGDVLFCVVFELVDGTGEKLLSDEIEKNKQNWG